MSDLADRLDVCVETTILSQEERHLLCEIAERLRENEQDAEKIAGFQPKALAIIEGNGFVFEDIGREPGNWQHLAFTLYTEICEIETIARRIAGADDQKDPPILRDAKRSGYRISRIAGKDEA